MSTAFGYTVIWVPDVEKTVAFYEQALGMNRRSVRNFGNVIWAEMETGATTLAFASEGEAQVLFPEGFYPNRPEQAPPLMLVSLLTDDVPALHQQALKHGATAVSAPKQMPWGQTVARVRDLNGVLVSMATPMGG